VTATYRARQIRQQAWLVSAASKPGCRIWQMRLVLVVSAEWNATLFLKLSANKSYYCKCYKKCNIKKKSRQTLCDRDLLFRQNFWQGCGLVTGTFLLGVLFLGEARRHVLLTSEC
jgi:hypothetical protein